METLDMEPKISKVWVDNAQVYIQTANGTVYSEKFADYARLRYATQQQRESFSLDCFGIHWEEIDEDLSYAGFMHKKPENNICQAFSRNPEVNVSGVARRMGIQQSLMASYLGGAKKPSRARKKQIENTLHEIGKSLIAVKLD
jgi:hypothetical protein